MFGPAEFLAWKAQVHDQHGRARVAVFVGSQFYEAWWRFATNHCVTPSTERHYANAVCRLIDFIAAHSDSYLLPNTRHLLARDFADALLMGTIQDGADPSGLWWTPRRAATARRLLAAASEFSDYLASQEGVRQINPFRDATRGEQIRNWRRWSYIKERSLLGHLHTREQAHGWAAAARTAHVRRQAPRGMEGDVRAFPDDRFWDLLEIGFAKRGVPTYATAARRMNMRDICIALLLHGGGLRVSEPCHLWVGDVFRDPDDADCAVVRVFHPAEGLVDYTDPATGSVRSITRATYLRLIHNRLPLTDLPRKQSAGWKNPLMSDSRENFMHVFWRSPEYGRMFLRCFEVYWFQQRPSVTSHPYLFVTADGAPMTPHRYSLNHATAVRRIGLTPAKDLGTTPHGHRHAYGRYLRAAGVAPEVRRVAMHHKSIHSQEPYTAANAAEVRAALDQADALAMPQLFTERT